MLTRHFEEASAAGAGSQNGGAPEADHGLEIDRTLGEKARIRLPKDIHVYVRNDRRRIAHEHVIEEWAIAAQCRNHMQSGQSLSGAPADLFGYDANQGASRHDP